MQISDLEVTTGACTERPVIVVEWADEPYKGKTQAILAHTIVETPLDQIRK